MTLPADVQKNNSDIAQFFVKGDEITVNGEKSSWVSCNADHLTLRVGEQEKSLKWTDITDVAELSAKRKQFAQEFQKLLALGWTLVKRERASVGDHGLPQPLLVEFRPSTAQWLNYYNYGAIEPSDETTLYSWTPAGDLDKLPTHADCFLIRRAIEGQKNDKPHWTSLEKMYESILLEQSESALTNEENKVLKAAPIKLEKSNSIEKSASLDKPASFDKPASSEPSALSGAKGLMSWNATRRVYCYCAPGTSRPDYLEGPDAHKEVLKAILANDYRDDEWAVNLSSTGQIVINQLPV